MKSFLGWSICTGKPGGNWNFKKTPPQQLEEFNDMGEGFVDDSMTAPSMSEHEMTVGTGSIEGEEEVHI